ncbi:MAG: Sec-independent protein translocase protein TatB [Rugosibacter sp.]|jgi:sec-independent protein translocase protein TatB|nr:Sec-independent protein translocase protein TatB [Rugosibacter sp.]MDO9272162.1 Sec-independent protein translocase protein TatB [Rugosibacter sp.]
MFDIGFSELLLIAVVALIVIGPERLPKVARTAGLFSGRLRRYVNDVKADISREMQLEELKKMQQDVADRIVAAESTVRHEMHEVESEMASVAVQKIAPPGLEVEDIAVPQEAVRQEDLFHAVSSAPTFPGTASSEKTSAELAKTATSITPTERT